MAKRRKADGDQGGADLELEIKRREDMTASTARGNPHAKILRISCFVKATSRCGLPANGMAVCGETARRIPFFLVLFPELEEVNLGGYSVYRRFLKGKEDETLDGEPFWFPYCKWGVHRQEEDEAIDASIRVIFDLVNSLCEAYRMVFLPARVKILGLFDPPYSHSRHTLLCEDKLCRDYGNGDERRRDGVTCQTCRNICRTINAEQAVQLRCAEAPSGFSAACGGNYLARLEFIGCQLCLTSRTKFEIVMSRADADDSLLHEHLLNILSDEESVKLQWYACDDQGRAAEDGNYRSGVMSYSWSYDHYDSIVWDEIKELLVLLKGKIKSGEIVAAIVSNPRTRLFTIGEEMFVAGGTWNCLKDSLDAEDRKKFRAIDMEKYGCWGDDTTFERECWRDEDG